MNSFFNFKENEYEDNSNAVQRYRPKPIEDLVKETRFNKKEIQLLYRGFKQECPSGIVNEQLFKEVYAHYFPQGGIYSFHSIVLYLTLVLNRF